MEDYIDSDMDQLIMFYKIKYEKELDRILVDVKGNTLNEKLHRALDCDESTFKEIINKEIWVKIRDILSNINYNLIMIFKC